MTRDLVEKLLGVEQLFRRSISGKAFRCGDLGSCLRHIGRGQEQLLGGFGDQASSTSPLEEGQLENGGHRFREQLDDFLDA